MVACGEGQMDFFRSLGSPRFICGPMVDASELAFRMLVRKYGAELAYTPMLNAGQFVANPKFRSEGFTTCEGDRPLVAQVAGNDPQVLLEAAKLVENSVDAVDINFGCPQHIAKRGHYGAFLQDEWDLMKSLISTLHSNLNVPVWCKVRVFPDHDKTIAYARMIEEAGCQALAVHGRTRDCKGRNAGRADWNIIRDVKGVLSIPVFANGDVISMSAAQECLRITKCDAVMCAYPLLENPQLFMGVENPDKFALSREYLSLATKYDTPAHQARGHIFKLLKGPLQGYPDLNAELGFGREMSTFLGVVDELESRTVNAGPVLAVAKSKGPTSLPVGDILDDGSVTCMFGEL